MVRSKISRVSIVIPVYNEADSLDACLRAIARQTVRPCEVLVVDNNSTDGSAAIAQRYPFVTLLREPRQGVIHARNYGFDTACGDIIGRIDADTSLPADWVATVVRLFSESDIDAVSGAVDYYDIAIPRVIALVDLGFRLQMAHGMKGEVFLYGANMAIRRTAWLKARSALCLRAGIHEDYDLAIHAYDSGAWVVFDKRLRATTTLRRFDMDIVAFWRYAMLNTGTYAQHGRTSRRHMYPAMTLLIVFYWFLRALHRGYDVEARHFSWQKLLGDPVPARVNPATFVD